VGALCLDDRRHDVPGQPAPSKASHHQNSTISTHEVTRLPYNNTADHRQTSKDKQPRKLSPRNAETSGSSVLSKENDRLATENMMLRTGMSRLQQMLENNEIQARAQLLQDIDRLQQDREVMKEVLASKLPGEVLTPERGIGLILQAIGSKGVYLFSHRRHCCLFKQAGESAPTTWNTEAS